MELVVEQLGGNLSSPYSEVILNIKVKDYSGKKLEESSLLRELENVTPFLKKRSPCMKYEPVKTEAYTVSA